MIIEPLVRRHAEDAAFYWLQTDAAYEAVNLTMRRARHFMQLLGAHLEGLEIAGPHGGRIALDALERWKKPGEAFVAVCSALSSRDEDHHGRVWHRVRSNPDLLLRGAIAAVAWAREPIAQAWVAEHAKPHSTATPELTTALRAAAILGWGLPASVEDYSSHPHHSVRAAVCRCMANGVDAHTTPWLQQMMADADVRVRAEAAIALAPILFGLRGESDFTPQVAGVLWNCVDGQIQLASAATGWNKTQHKRRLDRWLRHLAWLVPLGHPGGLPLLQRLPGRHALSFLLYHGDPHHLPYVAKAGSEPAHARWAGWVWQTLTGVNLSDPANVSRLTLAEPPLDLDATLSRAQQDADGGLPLPNAQAMLEHPATRQRTARGSDRSQRLMLGQPVTAARMLELLLRETNAPMAVHAMACHALGYLQPGLRLSSRSSFNRQSQQVAALAQRL